MRGIVAGIGLSWYTKNMSDDRFTQLQNSIKKFSSDRNWSQFHDPKNLALSLNLEASEVLELFQWTQDNKVNPDKESEISGEIADVFYWLVMLANHYELDLIDILKKKMVENEEKYPIEKAKGVSAKYTEL